MALTATIHHFEVTLADIDRGVYETLDLRLARHPSESMRYLITRTLAYCLSYEAGIAFSKGGLSSVDEPPISVCDLTGQLLAWIDIGTPSAERLHTATKAAQRVALFTHVELLLLQRDAATRSIYRVEEIQVSRLAPEFLDAIAATLERRAEIEVMRNDGQLYVTAGGKTLEGPLTQGSLVGIVE